MEALEFFEIPKHVASLWVHVAHGQRPCGPPGASFRYRFKCLPSKFRQNWPGFTWPMTTYSSKHPNCDLKRRAVDPESLAGQMAGLHQIQTCAPSNKQQSSDIRIFWQLVSYQHQFYGQGDVTVVYSKIQNTSDRLSRDSLTDMEP